MADRPNWYGDHPPACTCWRCNEGRGTRIRQSSPVSHEPPRRRPPPKYTRPLEPPPQLPGDQPPSYMEPEKPSNPWTWILGGSGVLLLLATVILFTTDCEDDIASRTSRTSFTPTPTPTQTPTLTSTRSYPVPTSSPGLTRTPRPTPTRIPMVVPATTPTAIPTPPSIPVHTLVYTPTSSPSLTATPVPTPVPTQASTHIPTPTPVAAPFPGGTPLDAAVIYSLVIQLTNEERIALGLSALREDMAITAIALSHSANMSQTRILSHTLDGQNSTDRALAAGYDCKADRGDGSYTYGLSENIAMSPRVRTWTTTTKGGRTVSTEPTSFRSSSEIAQDLVTGWMNSPGHRANILDPYATRIGVGIYIHREAEYGNTSERVWATQNFSDCK